MNGLVFGRYIVGRPLAAGGMGAVYLGFDRDRGDRPVVLKTMLPELAAHPSMVAQFRDEAAITRLIRHPNVVDVLDVGQHEGTWVIVMEYIAGMSLAELMRSAWQAHVDIEPATAARVVRDALFGLDGAHRTRMPDGRRAEIIHRDISPQNVMVAADGTTKIVDFGVARAAVRETQTATGLIKGKVMYMSPEQLRSEQLDGRSDQFAMGIVLWELCAGERLCASTNEVQAMRQILEETAPRLDTIAPNVPSRLADIVERMLSKDREDRFPTCRAAALALDEPGLAMDAVSDVTPILRHAGWSRPDLSVPAHSSPLIAAAGATVNQRATPLAAPVAPPRSAPSAPASAATSSASRPAGLAPVAPVGDVVIGAPGSAAFAISMAINAVGGLLLVAGALLVALEAPPPRASPTVAAAKAERPAPMVATEAPTSRGDAPPKSAVVPRPAIDERGSTRPLPSSTIDEGGSTRPLPLSTMIAEIRETCELPCAAEAKSISLSADMDSREIHKMLAGVRACHADCRAESAARIDVKARPRTSARRRDASRGSTPRVSSAVLNQLSLEELWMLVERCAPHGPACARTLLKVTKAEERGANPGSMLLVRNCVRHCRAEDAAAVANVGGDR